MILDTSAIVAILFKEPGFEVLLEKLAGADSPAIGAPTLVEAAIVVSARIKQDARALISRLLAEGSITRVPFGEEHYGAAVEAWLRYGKGRHRAALNFGDCMSYATAALSQQPLLCTGADFSHTDLRLA
jgi:ribonuclease VapC